MTGAHSIGEARHQHALRKVFAVVIRRVSLAGMDAVKRERPLARLK
jgi:hypothetical protein